MSESSGLKLTYNAAQMRARLEANAADFRRLTSLPADIKLRAQAKLKAEQLNGSIVDVASSFNILEQFIGKIKNSAFNHIANNHNFAVTLALGIPPVVELFKIKSSPNGTLYLSFEGKLEQIYTLNFYSFAICIRHALKPFNFNIDPSQIAILYWRLLQGYPLGPEALVARSQPTMKKRSDGAPYSCFFNVDLQALVLRIFDMRPLLTVQGRHELLKWLASEAAKYEELNFGEHFLLERLTTAACGFEALGLNLPLDILAGLRPPIVEAVSPYRTLPPPSLSGRLAPSKLLPQAPSSIQPLAAPVPSLAPRYPGANLLQIEVAPDAMTARIVAFSSSFYELGSLDEAWLRKELDRLKMHAVSADQFKVATDLLKQRGDLTGIQIASGTFGRAGAKPYIAQIARTNEAESSQVDHRKLRPRLIAKAGEHIANIAYELAEEPGMDVFGRALPPPPPELAEFVVGPGIELRDGRHFHAEHDGVLQIQRQSIEISRALVHAGDVNLASGDIDFDGPVLIQGSIDTGASVRSSGDLTVEGSIRGRHVYCGGNLEVKAGINSTQRGLIFCRGNLRTEFIESSVVVCLGNLQAEKAILNSTLFVEGDLMVASQRAVLAGGDLYVWGELRSTDVGLPSGVETNIHLGCNWRWARQVESNKRRLRCFENLIERTQKEWQELKNKSKSQMSTQKKDTLSVFDRKLEKLQKIIARCQSNLQRFKRDRPFNQKSRALVRGKIQPRCHFYADSKKIKVPENIQAVAVLAFSSDGEGSVRALAEA